MAVFGRFWPILAKLTKGPGMTKPDFENSKKNKIYSEKTSRRFALKWSILAKMGQNRPKSAILAILGRFMGFQGNYDYSVNFFQRWTKHGLN